jgi:Flp pilus assembly protein TadG
MPPTFRFWQRTARLKSPLTKFAGLCRRLAVARSGATAATLALSLPAVIGLGGLAVDYNAVSGSKNRLQQVIDSAAIAVAREMTLIAVNSSQANLLAGQYVAANIPANTPYKISVTAELLEENFAVRVKGQQQVVTPLGLIERFVGVSVIEASALARVTAAGQSKLCLLSLSQKTNGGIYMHNGAMISAAECVFHSNSTQKKAVILSAGSKIKASQICARGGIENQSSTIEGQLVTDCAEMKDPLASKPEPQAPLLCNGSKLAYNSGSHALSPGAYCNGLTISGTAKVKLNPGVYFFRGGALSVTDSAEFTGAGVTLVFLDNKSPFKFENNSLIQLSAPTSGLTAGMLLWESASVLPLLGNLTEGLLGLSLDKPKKVTAHHINSDRARELTGTIYLRQGALLIDSTRPIADLSPYTIMVVETLDLYDGPNLVLNSNYSGTAIPIPAGLGPIGGKQVRLGQ